MAGTVRDTAWSYRHPLLLGLVVALAAAPLFGGKYVFPLDSVAGPSWQPLLQRGFGFRTTAYGGSLPLFGVLSAVIALVGAGVAQKLLFVGSLAFVAVAGYTSLPGTRTARTYGTLLLLVNPFVYMRLLAGHWAVIWGLAALPLVVDAYTSYLESPRPRRLLWTVVTITLLGFNAHLLYIALGLLALLTLFGTVRDRDLAIVQRALTVAGVAIPVNAYWLVPTLLDGSNPVTDFTVADLVSFAPEGGVFATATMRGFWRGGYVHATDLVPALHALYGVVLLLAVYGVVTHYDDGDRGYVVTAIAIAGVVAILLGAGVHGPAAPAFRWAFEHVPLFAGMRDSNKFVALVVFAYAALGSLGVVALQGRLRSLDAGVVAGDLLAVERQRLLSAVVLGLVVCTPLVYTFPMLTGYAGQVSADDYPEAWYEVDRLLDDDAGDYNVLFLPWHQYMDYSWLDEKDQRVATPARRFFSKPIIQGDNEEIGATYSTSDNPLSRYVEFLFGLRPGTQPPDATNMGELLAHANVKYVLLTKEADWRDYDRILRDQRDLRLVRENDYFRVYRNERSVERAFAADGVSYVRNYSQFVAASQREATDGVYVLADAKTDRTVSLDDADSDPRDGDREGLAVAARSPTHYEIEGTSQDYTVMTQPQTRVGRGWRYAGDPPAAHHLGMQPVFTADRRGGAVRFAPFYRLYLPSYALSVLVALALGWYGLATGAGVETPALPTASETEDDD